MAVDVLSQFHADVEGMEHIISGLTLARESLVELCDTLAPTLAETEAPASGAADAEEPATLSELKSAVRTMDRHSQVAFDEIEALAEVADAALTQVDTTKVRTHLRTLMGSISYKAQDAMNEINSAAERVGCNYKEDREVAHG
jgi:hypothetical protein